MTCLDLYTQECVEAFVRGLLVDNQDAPGVGPELQLLTLSTDWIPRFLGDIPQHICEGIQQL